jgi:hypothetical protein
MSEVLKAANKPEIENYKDELYEALQQCIHYYKGMQEVLAKDEYGKWEAFNDMTTLMSSEWGDIVSILKDLVLVSFD